MSMKLTNMALTKSEKNGREKPMALDEGKYPWGLGLCLDNQSLKKLGRTQSDFKSGGYVFLLCKAKCTSVTSRDEGGKEETSVSLQIESMDLQTKSDRVSEAFGKVYGDDG